MNVLLAIDEPTASCPAVDYVMYHPWPEKTMFRVLSAPGRIPAVLDGTGKTGVEEAFQVTRQVVESLSSNGLPCDQMVRTGDPVEAIVDEAKIWPADLIILGSDAIRRWLPRAVSRSVSRLAPCEVKVILPRSKRCVRFRYR